MERTTQPALGAHGAARRQDVNMKKQSNVRHFRQRRTRGRLAEECACLTVTIPDNVLPPPAETRALVDCSVDANSTNVVTMKHVEDNPDSPLALAESPELCSETIEKLVAASSDERHVLLSWLLKSSRQLALSKAGCRVVQKAFEVGGPSDQALLIMELAPHIVELYESPWGNHVLSRAIEVLPAARNDFVITALRGRAVAVSKHRFGCRIVCRLIEHCTEQQIGSFLDELVLESDLLARHAFGNFVVQSMLEHASPARRAIIFWKILPDFPALATHRTGSLVAQRALDYCDVECKNHAIKALLQAEESSSPVEVACSHYGSYVMEQIASLRHHANGVLEISHVLTCSLEKLRKSEHADRVITAFGLA